MSTFYSPESVNVTLNGRRDFANGTKVRVLRWGDSPQLPGWAQIQPLVFSKERGRRNFYSKGNVMMKLGLA